MFMSEKNIFLNIQQLIDNKHYERAIKKVNKLIPNTTQIRKCINLKAACYIMTGHFSDANDLYKDYYPYSMIDEEDVIALGNIKEIQKYFGNRIKQNKYEISYNIYLLGKDERDLYILEKENEFNIYYEHFLRVIKQDSNTLENIIVDNIQFLRITEAAVFYAYSIRNKIKLSDAVKNEFSEYTQALSFSIELNKIKDIIFCVITKEKKDLLRDKCLVKALSYLGKSVYHIIPSATTPTVDHNYDPGLEDVGNLYNVIIINALQSGNCVEPSCSSAILHELNSQNLSDQPIVLFGESNLLMDINEDTEMSKILEMYYRHYEEQPLQHKDCLLIGSYFKTFSFLWGYDVKKEFERNPVCDFSIIIPVRNSLKYLQETIETCIEQDYVGSYEILISDNGWHKNINVKGILDKITNDKVRYIRTPDDLTLSKSFEFAFLNSRGKYLLSIGADDGIMPNALSNLKLALEKYPNNNVVAWPLAMYFWPDFLNKPQAHIYFEKNLSSKQRYTEYVTKPLIKHFVLGSLSFTDLPMMYLTACIRREQLEKIIQSTGKFENGDSQDIYTGILNLFLENRITYCDYPVIICGNSEVGVGYNSNQSVRDWSKLSSTLRTKYAYYRYRNYYSKVFRIVSLPYPAPVNYFVFREYIKIRHFFRKHYIQGDDIVKILDDLHKALLNRNIDLPGYYNKIENIARFFGTDVYAQYVRIFNKYIMLSSFRNFALKFISNNKIKSVLYHIYFQINRFFIKESSKELMYSTEHILQNKNKNREKVDIYLNDPQNNGLRNAIKLLYSQIGK